MAIEKVEYYKISVAEYNKLTQAVKDKHQEVINRNKKIKELEAKIKSLEPSKAIKKTKTTTAKNPKQTEKTSS